MASWRDRGTGGEAIYFYNYDKRGSTTNIVDPSGNSVKQYTYDEFGNVGAAGSFDNEITFTGSVSDASTGLQYMNSRYYDASTGRFLSQDTYSGNAFEPWTQHLYSYCGNNPTNFVDPMGHAPKYITEQKFRTDYDKLKTKHKTATNLMSFYSKAMDNFSSKSDVISKKMTQYLKDQYNMASSLATSIRGAMDKLIADRNASEKVEIAKKKKDIWI